MMTAIPVHRWGPQDQADGVHRLGPCYVGVRTKAGCCVSVMPQDIALPAGRCTAVRYPDDQYEWGYGGSGPHALAIALLTHATGRKVTGRAAQRFKGQVIACMKDAEAWLIYQDDILDWMADNPDLYL